MTHIQPPGKLTGAIVMGHRGETWRAEAVPRIVRDDKQGSGNHYPVGEEATAYMGMLPNDATLLLPLT